MGVRISATFGEQHNVPQAVFHDDHDCGTSRRGVYCAWGLPFELNVTYTTAKRIADGLAKLTTVEDVVAGERGEEWLGFEVSAEGVADILDWIANPGQAGERALGGAWGRAVTDLLRWARYNDSGIEAI